MVLADLLAKYASTEYGASHNAAQIKSTSDYRDNFRIINYSGLIPYLKQVKERSYKAFLSEQPENLGYDPRLNRKIKSPTCNPNPPKTNLQLRRTSPHKLHCTKKEL